MASFVAFLEIPSAGKYLVHQSYIIFLNNKVSHIIKSNAVEIQLRKESRIKANG
jgi:hypothetical protein